MASAASSVTLSNGIKMPILGLGTSHGGGYNQKAVIYALKDCGYRLIDTARRYGCEQFIGEAIQESGVPREDLFLATKMWPTDYGFSRVRTAFQTATSKLGTEYLDLYMLHWPLCPSSCSNPKEIIAETWRALEVLMDEEHIKAIGVSNFSIQDLKELFETASVVPHVNQCEFHPYQNPKELRDFCSDNKIQFEGYCPLAKGRIFHKEPIVQVSKALDKSPAQILIRWSIQNGVVTIPKSTKEERVYQNAQVFDFELSEEHMELLNNLHSDFRVVNPDEIQLKIDDNKPDGYKLFTTGRSSVPREMEQA